MIHSSLTNSRRIVLMIFIMGRRHVIPILLLPLFSMLDLDIVSLWLLSFFFLRWHSKFLWEKDQKRDQSDTPEIQGGKSRWMTPTTTPKAPMTTSTWDPRTKTSSTLLMPVSVHFVTLWHTQSSAGFSRNLEKIRKVPRSSENEKISFII